ncbi:hypothetical protein [Streptomyces sp. NPDC012510]|uniref:hypothetical protein n=1 Tax=Streptomyces sp. NPDC012510 TaxID=3364838 RepID=UPI0036F0108A
MPEPPSGGGGHGAPAAGPVSRARRRRSPVLDLDGVPLPVADAVLDESAVRGVDEQTTRRPGERVNG